MKNSKTDLEKTLPSYLVREIIGYVHRYELLKLAQGENEVFKKDAEFCLKQYYGIDRDFIDSVKLVIPKELIVEEDNQALMIYLEGFTKYEKLRFEALIFDEEIPQAKNVFDGEVLKYIVTNFERLKYLELENCDLKNADISCLLKLPLLQYLNLANCQNLDSSIMPDISQIKSLRVLNLENCGKISYISISSLSQNFELRSLEYLNANGCKHLPFAGSLGAYFDQAIIVDHTGFHKPEIEENKSANPIPPKTPSSSPQPKFDSEKNQFKKLVNSGCCSIS